MSQTKQCTLTQIYLQTTKQAHQIQKTKPKPQYSNSKQQTNNKVTNNKHQQLIYTITKPTTQTA